MTLDLSIILVLLVLVLVSWNVYLSLGRKENKEDDSKFEDIKTSLFSQSSSLEGLIRDVASFQDPLNKLNRNI